ncbi:hypothetical protein WDV06_13090 [Streptomyces racemochromogenes]|uniref:Uncharacterized protein n=1 Tax=Streptomyces racemochromogenes TaxID=67353 RepID=A0ABW7PDM7_9ACTN
MSMRIPGEGRYEITGEHLDDLDQVDTTAPQAAACARDTAPRRGPDPRAGV